MEENINNDSYLASARSTDTDSHSMEANSDTYSREKDSDGKSGMAGYLRSMMDLPDTDIKSYSPLTLAYIGDAIYDLVVRTIMVEHGNAPVNKLHKRVSKLVQAGAQANLYFMIKDQLTEEETSIFKRGRNAKSYTSAKNAGVVEYRTATGVETLMGYLYLTGQTDRMLKLMKPILNKIVNIS